MSTKDLSLIVKDLELAKDIQSFNQLLDTPPKQEWVKQNPYIKSNGKPLDYIPVSIYRKLLRDIFQHFNIEVLDSKVVFNAIQVTVRIHYLHPVSGEWRYVDGIGAMSMQTDKGAKAMDAGSLKNDAVQKAAPAAKSYAMKNALSELGDIFGGGLNSDVEYQMEEIYSDPKPEFTIEMVDDKLAGVIDPKEVRQIFGEVEKEWSVSVEVKNKFLARYNELRKTAKTPKATAEPPSNVPSPPAETSKKATNGHDPEVIRSINACEFVEGLNAIYKELHDKGIAKQYLPHLSNRKKQIENAN